MSKAIYCDHCEEIFLEENTHEVKINLQRIKTYSPEEYEIDLCPECFEQLNSWIFGKLDVNVEKEVEDLK